MAIYRSVQMSFWTDSKVIDDFTPEDKYFFLYLMTNPHTNLSGCYEISLKQISIETGYTKDVISNLLERFEQVHNVIRYSKETKEVLILNWSKFNWTKSKDFRKPLRKELDSIKNVDFKRFLEGIYDGVDTVIRPCQDGVGTTVTVTVTDTDTDTDSKKEEKKHIEEIVSYLNEMTGQKYKPTSKETIKHIRARMKEGFTVEDFKTVIYKKTKQWKNDPKMVGYLRPQTLFSTKFEAYLNEKEAISKADAQKAMMAEWASQEGDRD